MASFNKRICLFILLLAICMAYSCNNSQPESVTQDFENIIQIERVKSISTRLFGAWSPPQLLNYFNPKSLTQLGLTSAAIVQDNAFLAWEIRHSTSVADKTLEKYTKIFSKDKNGVWANNTPFDQSRTNIGLPKFSMNQTTGEIIAAWVDNHSVYSSKYRIGLGWSPIKFHGNGENVYFSENLDKGVLLLWITLGSTSTVFNASFYDIQSGWTPMVSFTRNATIRMDENKPLVSSIVRLNNSDFLFSWVDKEQGRDKLLSVRLNSSLDWVSPIFIDSNNIENIDKIELALDVNTNIAKLFYRLSVDVIDGGIYIAEYFYNTGSDESWNFPIQLIRPTYTQISPQKLEFKILSNQLELNNISIFWISDMQDAINRYSVVKVSHFDNLSRWSEPLIISTPMFRFPILSPSEKLLPHISDLNVSQNRHGEISVVWVEYTGNETQLKISSMDRNQQWGSSEIVATESVKGTLIKSLSIDIDDNNSGKIVWIKEIYKRNNSDSPTTLNFYLSEKSKLGTLPQIISFDSSHSKSLTHINTSNYCIGCHLATGIFVDHSEVLGSCDECHNGTIAMGQTIDHIVTTNFCDACHFIGSWRPIIAVDHAEVIGRCKSCHDGLISIGKHQRHLHTTNNCITCHLTTTFIPFFVDHTETFGACKSCHNKPPLSHINASITRSCDNCHSISSWFSPIKSISFSNSKLIINLPSRSDKHILSSRACLQCHVKNSVMPVLINHSETLGACESCHNGVLAAGKLAIHLNSTDFCVACHLTKKWMPAALVNHNEVIGVCKSCHNGIIAMGKTNTHPDSENVCQICHGTNTWLPTLSTH